MLRQCSNDDAAILQLRAFLEDRNGAGTDQLDGDQLLEAIASLVQTGEVLILETPALRAERSLAKEPVRVVAASPPPRRSAAAAAAPAPAPAEPPTIPPTANRAALAAAMRSAADSGVPFCDT